jgi:hypothetical protein
MPRLEDVLTWLKAQYAGIYGDRIDLDPESPDGQVIGIEAEMLADLGQLVQLAYNGLASPGAATGSLLGNLCLLNGVVRRPGEYTSAIVTIEGQAGASVDPNFIIRNTANGTLFSPVRTATIPTNPPGQTTTTVVVNCRERGPIEALAGTLTQIITVTTGIVSVTNATRGTSGCLTESDGALRDRRYQSVALPSQAMTDGLQAALVNMDGVLQAVVWENDQDVPINIGQTGILAPHCIHVLCDVTVGGPADPQIDRLRDPIAWTIFNRKSGGCSTQGNWVKTIRDDYGMAHVIKYDLPTPVDVYIEINLTKRAGWPTDGENQIKNEIMEWATGTDADSKRNIRIGGDSNGELSWTDVLSAFVGKVGGFNLTSMKLGKTQGGGTPNTNLPIDYNEIARIDPMRITVHAT